MGTLLFACTVYADQVTFNFNSLADGASNAAIQTYMRGQVLSQLGLANAVSVWGAGAEKNYTGDNHVVGPVSGNTVTPLTLGNSDGGVQHALPWDAYLFNSDSVKITMLFTFPIYSARFDYEIFPNGNCADPSPYFPTPKGTCSVFPDFTFKAGNANPLTTYLYTLSLDPSKTGYPGLYTHSPFSGAVNKEKAPQFLGESGTILFPGGVTKLEFYDWPERIGIDNLVIQNVPEPSAMLVLGIGLVALLKYRKRAVN
jgi:hypothetical protein